MPATKAAFAQALSELTHLCMEAGMHSWEFIGPLKAELASARVSSLPSVSDDKHNAERGLPPMTEAQIRQALELEAYQCSERDITSVSASPEGDETETHSMTMCGTQITAADLAEKDPSFCCPLVGLYPCERERRGCYCHERHLLDRTDGETLSEDKP